MDQYKKAQDSIDKIEAELKRIGRWSEHAIEPSKLINNGAFGSKTMAPEEWLQFSLIPRVTEIIATKGDFPLKSSVSVWALKNLDGDSEANELIRLLLEFDRLFK